MQISDLPEPYLDRRWAELLKGIPARFLSWGVMHLLVDRELLTCVPDWDTTPRDWADGYSKVRYHALLRDRPRMAAYAAAIQDKVKDRIVLEIGTGAFAPLSQMAIQAGARKIYAIEANPHSVAAARRLIQAKGLQDRMEVIQGYSTDVVLPEKAEVLLHEIVGYFGSDEGMVKVIHDAKQRLLVEQPILIPAQCRVFCAPVYFPNPDKGSHLARAFQKIYFGAAKNSALYQIWNFPQENILAPCQVYEDRTFAGDFSLEESRSLEFAVDKAADFSGFLLWMKLSTDDRHAVETLRGTSWGTAYLRALDQPMRIQPGDVICLDTYQDLRQTTRYSFHTRLKRNGQTHDFGSRYVRWT